LGECTCIGRMVQLARMRSSTPYAGGSAPALGGGRWAVGECR
jgi:hypothetical protein